MRLSRRIAAGLLAFWMMDAQAGEALDRIKRTGHLVIAHRDASIPFSYLDEHGKPIGYSIDLCLRIADAVKKRLGMQALEIRYLPVTSATRIDAIVKGDADLECESTTNNADRRQKVAFSIPHFITGTRFLVRADSAISELRDFENKRLVSTAGTTDLQAISQANQERLMGIAISAVPDHNKGVEMVEKGTADGFALDDVILYGLIASRADPARLKVVGRYLTIDPLGIMFSKADADLRQIVDDEMRAMIRSQDMKALYDRWFMAPIPPRGRSLDLPLNYLTRDFWLFPTSAIFN